MRARFQLNNLARRTVTLILLAGSLGVAGGVASPAAADPGHLVRGRLLPVPAAGPGAQLTVTAVDVSPRGVVAGTAHVVTTNPDGTQSTADTPQRWAKVPHTGWQRQQLTLPAGATSGTVAGLTDRGEAAGEVTLDGATRAARWSVGGRSATLIGEAGSRVSAVGPSGPWGVFTGFTNPNNIFAGNSESVTRDGTRTALNGTPELDAGYRRWVSAVPDPDTALVWVVDGIGRGINSRPVLWQGGATVRLPVFSPALLEPACVSRLQSDGSVIASGYNVEAGIPSFVLVRHVGGVPGTDLVLSRATGPGRRISGISCESGRASNGLAADGGIAGYVNDADGRRAAYWNAADVLTVVPLEAGEQSATGVAAAAGGRMVIQARGDDGSTGLSLWRDGVRTPLSAPAGWSVASVVELTEAGLLIANVRDAAGTVRPAAWDLTWWTRR